MRSEARFALAVVWALLVGISVPLEVCNTSLLNRQAKDAGVDSSLHGFYISQIAVAMGGLQLIVPSVSTKVAWRFPVKSKWWSWLGGVCSLLGFITVSATPLLGAQVVLMVQLVGVLGTFFVLDILNGTVKLRHWHKPVGFFVAIIGVGVDNLSMFTDSATIDASWIFHFVGTFLSGVGYGLQAKCNGALAEDVGGPARAAMVSAAVNIVASVPISIYIAVGQDVPLTLNTWLWPLWFVAGFQSAFYIGSMAILPSLLGFTTSYLAVLSSKLVCSTFVDEFGLSGKVVKVTYFRVISLLLVLSGAYVFNACDRKEARDIEPIESADAENADEGHLPLEKSSDNLPLTSSRD